MKDKMKKTKIVCTIGPASENPKMLKKLVLAGMNVMRCNFSHGDFEEHGKKMQTMREVNAELGTHCAILLDTKGPEIRTGDFEGGFTEFKKGQVSTICVEDIVGTADRFTISYKDLYKDVKPGGFILVNDGQVELLVDHVEGTDIVCVCANDGKVKNKRGINVPGIELGFEFISEKDRADLVFGCEQDVDYIAASFVRRPQDVLDVKKVLVENGKPEIQIIAKIENSEGVEKMDDIIKVADGIMVARGDLGVEVPAEDVPLIQKELIRKCKAAGKIVITATQMLESMQENPRPTRAEVSDVANAIFDGTDAIMLSGESAQGKYPEEAVMVMNKIALKTESTLDYASLHRKAVLTATDDSSEAICMSVAEIANKFDVSAIIAFTESGFTAKKMSRYRPECPIIAATPFEKTTKKLAINWGIKAVVCKQMDTREGLLNLAEVIAKENGINAGETILVTGGTPGVEGTTSYLQLVTVK
ncbi:MAG: pyruvate kinase [Coprobacillus cateniformis]|uniref:Pyruvate kinase n=1 Tax=Longibaculum muris TaxID=1796628 RepID=A0A4R3Z535_9FIRM|nr:pyruvate kinase [Longibaculum muris]KXU45286.1 pyruvate kinase [Candidatus Stoquefichus sp. KLE1796]MBS5113277.1 pyruvate kinase [Coprobacillus cateniformis]MBS5369815.1 pyruvate kinase [Coprobacillus cateniformis]MCR1886506.1 pyruvate kinase [Longibaculum muris]MED9811431.1 pyruvate kinase [Longibaculum muris]